MTDRFVPDRPGYYWHAGGIAEVFPTNCGDLRVWYGGQGIDNSGPLSDIHEWLSPVTPPDVVADMVAALERAESLLRQCEAAAKGENVNQPHHSGLGETASIARAALQRYRGG